MLVLKNYLMFIISVFSTTSFWGSMPYISSDDKKTTLQQEIPLQDEKFLDVHIEFGAGNIELHRSSSENIMEAYMEYISEIEPKIDYEVYRQKGILDIKMEEKSKKNREDRDLPTVNYKDIEENRWDIKLTGSIPVAINLSAGAATGELDMTGLKLEELDIETGASSLTLNFETPNTQEMRQMAIKTGASKFKGYNLGNANCEVIDFAGGLGIYTLDFRGNYSRKTDVKISIAWASITLLVPQSVGVRILNESSFLSSYSVPDGFEKQRKNEYYSPNYGKTQGELDIHIDASVGSNVDIEWVN